MRVKRLSFSPEFLCGFLRTGNCVFFSVREGIPAEATVVRCLVNYETGGIEVFLASETFEDVPEGKVVPYLPPVILETHAL